MRHKSSKRKGQYVECPLCGASLDPGEKCDCESEPEQSTDPNKSFWNGDMNTPIDVSLEKKRILDSIKHPYLY